MAAKASQPKTSPLKLATGAGFNRILIGRSLAALLVLVSTAFWVSDKMACLSGKLFGGRTTQTALALVRLSTTCPRQSPDNNQWIGSVPVGSAAGGSLGSGI